MGTIPDGVDEHLVTECIDRTTEHVAGELHRQLGFFWNAAATDRAIDAIYVAGGGSQVHGLLEELSAKTGMQCHDVDVYRGLDCSGGIDSEYLKEIGPAMSVSVGLALRREGDKPQLLD